MNLLSIHLTPRALLRLTKAEVRLLIDEGQMHYDGYCKSCAHPGGFLWGWKNYAEYYGHTEVTATMSDIDTCCKILEMSRDPDAGKLSWALGQAHRTISNAYTTFQMEDA